MALKYGESVNMIIKYFHANTRDMHKKIDKIHERRHASVAAWRSRQRQRRRHATLSQSSDEEQDREPMLPSFDDFLQMVGV
jgi:hypothetical protein